LGITSSSSESIMAGSIGGGLSTGSMGADNTGATCAEVRECRESVHSQNSIDARVF
jgi:hypothetical protein